MANTPSNAGFDVHTFIREEPKLSSLNALVQAVEDAESFLQDFPEVSYEVSKTLHGWVGKKVTRRLKLTTRGIANLRRSGAPSSLYEYDRIIKVTMSNINTLVIEYKGAKHPYTYSAPNAMEIVHEISTRVKFFNAALKKRMTLRLATPYLDVLEAMRANQLVPRRTVASRTSLLDNRVSRMTLSIAQARTIADASSIKLMAQINAYLLDKSYEEAKVVKNFLDHFDSIEKKDKSSIETTRNFLTSLKERIMETRYDQMVPLTPPFRAAVETQAEAIGREVEMCIEKTVVLKLHDRLIEILAKTNKKDDAKIEQKMEALQTKPQSYFGIPAGLEASSKWQLAVIEINELGTLFLPQEKLRAILNCIAAIVDTAQFESDRRFKEQQRISNAQFSQATSGATSGSSPSSVSPTSSPSTASTNTGPIKPDSPTPNITSISAPTSESGLPNSLSSISSISPSAPTSTSSSGTDVNTSSMTAQTLAPPPTSSGPVQSKPVDLSADDLLPILIYVIVHSKLVRLETQCQYLWQMSDPADLVGESGYYLTMLSSAVEYLKQHEDELDAIQSSDPMKISSANSASHPNTLSLFDDSDSEDDSTPPSPRTANAQAQAPSALAWIGTKGTSSPAPASSPSVNRAASQRSSIFVIGSTRSTVTFPDRPTSTIHNDPILDALEASESNSSPTGASSSPTNLEATRPASPHALFSVPSIVPRPTSTNFSLSGASAALREADATDIQPPSNGEKSSK